MSRQFRDPAGDREALSVDFRAFDIFEFARKGGQISGLLGVAELPRMVTEVPPDAPAQADAALAWQARGGMRSAPGAEASGEQQPFLDLTIDGTVWLQCQRCMAAYPQPVSVDAHYWIVETEAQADAAPVDDDEIDVIVGSRRFDLRDLIDEELVLSLPLVPKHDVCPVVHESLVTGPDGQAETPAAPAGEGAAAGNSPFAALAALQGGRKAGEGN